MARKTTAPLSPWEDRFSRPSTETLLGALAEGELELVNLARQAFRDSGRAEHLEWLGVSWKWSFAYRRDRGDQGWGFLVPQPGSPRICLPVPPALLARAGSLNLPRSIRDALIFAPDVGGVRWPEWKLANRSSLDDVLQLARAKDEIAESQTVGAS